MRFATLRREVRRVARENPEQKPRREPGRWVAIAALYFVTLILVSPFYFQAPGRHSSGSMIREDITAQTAFSFETESTVSEWKRERERLHKRVYDFDSSIGETVLDEAGNFFRLISLIDPDALTNEELVNRVRRIDARFAFIGVGEVRDFIRRAQDTRFQNTILTVLKDAYEGQVVVDRKAQFLGHRKTGVADIQEIDQLLDRRRRSLQNPLSAPMEWSDWAPYINAQFYVDFGQSGPPPGALADAEQILRELVRPNLVYNISETQKAFERYKRPDLSSHYEEGDTILTAPENGRMITEDETILLSTHRDAVQLARLKRLIGHAVFVLIVYIILSFYVKKFSRELEFTTGNVILIATPIVLSLGIEFLFILVAGGAPDTVGYLFPAGSLGMLAVLLLDVRMALLLVTWGCLLLGLQVNLEYEYVIVGLFGGYTGVAALYTIRKRWELFLASVLIAVVNCAVIIITHFIDTPTHIPWTAAAVGFVGGISSFLVLAILPVFERFGVVTDMQLLELSGLHHPLLRQLEERAPGTWQHTLNVTKLAEAAATEIGVNYLLVRTGCYFHDIGKMKKPEYFTENQVTKMEKLKHQELKPQISTLVIKNHVKEGVEMARREGIPERIIDFIRQHHGTSVISYFYHKALEAHARGEIKEPVRIEDYRYPWEKPQSIEAAIVMLADSVEATATAKLSGRTVREDDINQVVRTVVFEKFNDGQFDECNLTMRDLNMIRVIFVRVLKSRFHTRIDYPKKSAKQAPPPKKDKERDQRDSADGSERSASSHSSEKIPLAAQE